MNCDSEYACVVLPRFANVSKEIVNAWVLFDPGPSTYSLYCANSFQGQINGVDKGSAILLLSLSGGVFRKCNIDTSCTNNAEYNHIKVDLIKLLKSKGFSINKAFVENTFAEDDATSGLSLGNDILEIGYCKEYKHFYYFCHGGIEFELRDGTYVLVNTIGASRSTSVYTNGENTEFIGEDNKIDNKWLGFSVKSYNDTQIDKILCTLNTKDEIVYIDKEILRIIINELAPIHNLELLFEQEFEWANEKRHVLCTITFLGSNMKFHDRLLECTTKNIDHVKTKAVMLAREWESYIKVTEL